MIKINKCYEIVTPESAEEGEAAETGFFEIDEPYTFRQLVNLMQQMPVVSCWPAEGEIYEWMESHPDQDYHTGHYTTESIHYSRSNPAHFAKYWKKAMQAAGLLSKEASK